MERPAHFQTILESESQRLNALCTKWQEIFDSSSDLTDELSGQILLAVGQTKLLVKEKFQQFRNLIKECELGTGPKTITVEDLHGFWDLICIQIDDVDRKFNYLDNLKKCSQYGDEYSDITIQNQPTNALSELQENGINEERLVVNNIFKNMTSNSDTKSKYFKT